MIKAAFFDLDGTLVPYGEHGMSRQLREDLLQLRKDGILTILATGRGKHDLKNIGLLGDVEFDAYITYNGYCCYDDQGTYRSHAMEQSDLKAACEVLRANPDIIAIIEGENGNFFNKMNEQILEQYKDVSPHAYPVRAPDESIGEAVYQVVPFIERGKEDMFLSVMPGCIATRWSEYATDIIPKGNGKADGIRVTLDRLGLKAEETIAFGDGENDIPMLRLSGIGVAMGNAGQIVKEAADYVTLPVREDGVSVALRHFGIISETV